MKYEILKKENRYGEVIDFIVTKNAGNMYIVERNGVYRIRRINNTVNEGWVWDLSEDVYNTLKEAECALLSCCVKFKHEID